MIILIWGWAVPLRVHGPRKAFFSVEMFKYLINALFKSNNTDTIQINPTRATKYSTPHHTSFTLNAHASTRVTKQPNVSWHPCCLFTGPVQTSNPMRSFLVAKAIPLLYMLLSKRGYCLDVCRRNAQQNILVWES